VTLYQQKVLLEEFTVDAERPARFSAMLSVLK
jgi:hypothetical protein